MLHCSNSLPLIRPASSGPLFACGIHGIGDEALPERKRAPLRGPGGGPVL